MPTYEYECTKCGTITEVFQSIKDVSRKKLRAEDRPRCQCRAGVTRRISTGGGLIFKGSGFYITDYRTEGYRQAAKADSEGGGKTDKGEKGDKTEKKDAEKKDASTSDSSVPVAPKKEKPASKSKTKE